MSPPRAGMSPEIRRYIDLVVKEAVRSAIDETVERALKKQTEHIDAMFAAQNLKLDPMHEAWLAAKFNTRAVLWVSSVGAGVVAMVLGVIHYLSGRPPTP